LATHQLKLAFQSPVMQLLVQSDRLRFSPWFYSEPSKKKILIADLKASPSYRQWKLTKRKIKEGLNKTKQKKIVYFISPFALLIDQKSCIISFSLFRWIIHFYLLLLFHATRRSRIHTKLLSNLTKLALYV
jgi:hypothetical protein